MQSAKSKPAVEAIDFPTSVARSERLHYARQTSQPHSAERLLTPQEVADRLGVSQRWVRDHATRRRPRITAVKLGSLLRFRWADVEDFLARHILQDPSQKDLGGV
jgi:excisionase family DNA binding protein